jgi:hypothetical protein
MPKNKKTFSARERLQLRNLLKALDIVGSVLYAMEGAALKALGVEGMIVDARSVFGGELRNPKRTSKSRARGKIDAEFETPSRSRKSPAKKRRPKR